ncbi:hypothetical protein C0993_007905 [Termitomyces sp. T159_Od127]|nr:hypothetical protein C0993_007905 [Termitomyces sp. T159_Od127]
MQGSGIMWERDRELLVWCMAQYHDNLGVEWLVPFANDFVPPAPSFDEELEALLVGEEPLVVSTATKDKEAVIAPLVEQDLRQQEQFWQDVAKKSKANTQRRIANSLEALAYEGLGLGEATEAGEGSWQGQEEEEEEKEDEEEGSVKSKRKASPPLLPTEKGKKRARMVSPAAVTPEVELEADDKGEVHRLSAAIEASKLVLGTENFAGPSHQAEVPQDVGALLEEMEQDEAEEGAEVGPEATP